MRDGNRTIIREGDRTIIRENNTTIIRHNESNRFSINARNVRTERRGANTETIVQRGGYSIVTVTDGNGRLLRRVRRDERGREMSSSTTGFAGPRAANVFVQLPPPVIRIPRERYIVEMRGAPREAVYEVFLAPPVEAIAEPYTLDQVRFSAPLRDRMPRVDLDVTFDTGSWQLPPEQIDKLAVIAEGINQAIQRNPKEVFMVEGYTDATGAEEDNLSLSDRRAESVAVALTEQFKVPPENLVTQGYGEQYLKVDTPGPRGIEPPRRGAPHHAAARQAGGEHRGEVDPERLVRRIELPLRRMAVHSPLPAERVRVGRIDRDRGPSSDRGDCCVYVADASGGAHPDAASIAPDQARSPPPSPGKGAHRRRGISAVKSSILRRRTRSRCVEGPLTPRPQA